MVKKNILTSEGLKKLEDELDELIVVKRKEVAQKIKEAREQGDLSENAEYDAAKNDQGKMEARIQELKTILDNSEIIDEDALSTDVISVGLSVKVYDKEFNEEVVYTIVNAPQADPFENRISDESPVGVALLGHAVGDTVSIETLAGTMELKILEIFK